VLDDRGGPLAEVRVSISSENLIGGPQAVLTDAAGGFAFNLLPVGQYTVAAEKTGFVPAAIEVPVRLDRTAAATLRMVPLSFSGEIEVGAEVPIVDVTRTHVGEVFSKQYLRLATIGSERRTFGKIMDQAAGVNANAPLPQPTSWTAPTSPTWPREPP
jgi:hypothetical protein